MCELVEAAEKIKICKLSMQNDQSAKALIQHQQGWSSGNKGWDFIKPKVIGLKMEHTGMSEQFFSQQVRKHHFQYVVSLSKLSLGYRELKIQRMFCWGFGIFFPLSPWKTGKSGEELYSVSWQCWIWGILLNPGLRTCHFDTWNLRDISWFPKKVWHP